MEELRVTAHDLERLHADLCNRHGADQQKRTADDQCDTTYASLAPHNMLVIARMGGTLDFARRDGRHVVSVRLPRHP